MVEDDMAFNQDRQTLYDGLVRGVYALDGIDGEFVAALCRQIPFKPGSAEGWPKRGRLAQTPAAALKAAVAEVGSAKGRIAKHRAHFGHLVREGRADTEGSWSTHEAFEYLLELRGELAEAEDGLAGLLAA